MKEKKLIPYEFGITGDWRADFDITASHLKRLRKLTELPEAALIVRVCKHYISNFIPCPVTQENEYWIMSCFPSTDQSPIRLSIWFPEVFNIHNGGWYPSYAEGLGCMVFVHQEFLEESFKAALSAHIEGLKFSPGYRFQTGIPQQLAAFMPLEFYFDFVNNDIISESIKAHNYELTLKGRSPFRGHNYELVRYLFGDQEILEGLE